MNTLIEQGVDEIHKENYALAAKNLERAVKIRPDIPEAQNVLGVAYMLLERSKDAEQCYMEAIRLNPYMADAYFNLGVLYRKEKKYDACFDNLRLALHFRQNDPQTLLYQGLAHADLEEYDEAIKAFNKALSHDHEFYPAYFALGGVYYILTNLNAAVEAYTQVTRLKSDAVDAHIYLGFTHWRLKQYKEAAGDFRRAVLARPDYALAHYYLGLAYVELHDEESALIEYNQLLGVDRELAEKLSRSIQGGEEELPTPPLLVTG